MRLQTATWPPAPTTPLPEHAAVGSVNTLEISVQVADTHSGVIVATVEVAGEIDAATASSLDDAFDEALEAHPTLVLFRAFTPTWQVRAAAAPRAARR